METTIAKVNDVNILLIDGTEKLVPIRPICDALGIAYQGQIDKIKNDEILGPTLMSSMAVAADKNEREMTCIPFMFVFGWLFTINPKKVKPKAKEAVIKYKLECYKALYNHFALRTDFLEERQTVINNLSSTIELAQKEFFTKKEHLAEMKKNYNEAKDLTFDQWQANKRQLSMDFLERKEEA